MFQKAIDAKDDRAAARILQARTGMEAKIEGGKVKGNGENWTQKKALDVMRVAVEEKFKQNPELYKVLKETKGCTLAECSPRDKFWGIGFPLKAKEAGEEHLWEGHNHLGKILTEVRLELAS